MTKCLLKENQRFSTLPTGDFYIGHELLASLSLSLSWVVSASPETASKNLRYRQTSTKSISTTCSSNTEKNLQCCFSVLLKNMNVLLIDYVFLNHIFKWFHQHFATQAVINYFLFESNSSFKFP